MARQSFNNALGKEGYAAFKVEGGSREQIREFDPTIGEIVLTRAMRGG